MEPEVSEKSAAFHRSPVLGSVPDVYSDRFPFGIARHTTQSVLAAILKNESDGFSQTGARLVLILSLAIRAGHFRAVRDDPFSIALEDSSEFIAHTTSPLMAAETRSTSQRIIARSVFDV